VGLEIDDEVMGQLSHYDTWTAESELLTKAFGQGISMTPAIFIIHYFILLLIFFSGVASKAIVKFRKWVGQ